MDRTTLWRRAGAAVVAMTAVTALSACSGSEKTYSIWDPYPQFDAKSAWVQLLDRCGAQAGVSIDRHAFDTTRISDKTLAAVQDGTAPDILVADNPTIGPLAYQGVLTGAHDSHIDTKDVEQNLLAPGQFADDTFGTPIGANTLALYYNRKLVKAAGIDVTTITDWASLTHALARAKAAHYTGITFAATAGEEGTFQFLPWFWGAGAHLTHLDTAPAVAALTLWADWLHQGYATSRVTRHTQTSSWQEFAQGRTVFAENGTWQLGNAEHLPFDYGVLAIPGRHGGTAPAPLGGEFVTIPVQRTSHQGRYATSEKIVNCLTGSANIAATDRTLSYIAPLQAVQQQQEAADPRLQVWIKAVQAAKGRTSDTATAEARVEGNLTVLYPHISQNLWQALQTTLAGTTSAQAALSKAQKQWLDNQ